LIKIFLYRLTSFPKKLIKKLKKFYRRILKKFAKPKPEKPYLFDDKPVGSIYFLLYDLKSRGLNCNYILDVGAHSAGWASLAKKIFTESVIYLIEPLAEMEDKLKNFCADFPSSKYFLNGAGSKEEISNITLSETLEGSNFLQKENAYLKSSNVQREVRIITIDSLIQKGDINIPDLVKLDVQGFELEALKGAELLFGKTEVFILEASFFEFVEGTPLFSEVIGFMADKGYEVYDFSGFLRRPYDRALGQIDICFVKREGFLRNSKAWHKA